MFRKNLKILHLLLQLSSMCLNLFENLSDEMKYFEIFSKHIAVDRTSNRSPESTIGVL